MSEHDDYIDHDLPPPRRIVRMGRRLWPWVVSLVVLVSLIVLGWLASIESCSLGSYDQVVILKTDRPIRAVKYGCTVDDDVRRAVGTSAPPRYADCRDGLVEDGSKFVANIRYGITSGPLRPNRIAQPPEMVVYVEFNDGSRTCQVVDLPKGVPPPPVTIRLP
jgi:hypothetical protein